MTDRARIAASIAGIAAHTMADLRALFGEDDLPPFYAAAARDLAAAFATFTEAVTPHQAGLIPKPWNDAANFDLAVLSEAERRILIDSSRKTWWRRSYGWRRQGDTKNGNARAIATLEHRGLFDRLQSEKQIGLRLNPFGIAVRRRLVARLAETSPARIGASA
jgi:hypothetical protein